MILAHRCTNCSHIELEARSHPGHSTKRPADLRKGTCLTRCSCQDHNFGPPEAIPSFTSTGRRIDRLAEPGTTLAGGLSTCTCKDCKAEYARRLNADAAT